MEPLPRIYTIRIQGELHERWRNWFDGMTVTSPNQGEVIIEGLISGSE